MKPSTKEKIIPERFNIVFGRWNSLIIYLVANTALYENVPTIMIYFSSVSLYKPKRPIHSVIAPFYSLLFFFYPANRAFFCHGPSSFPPL